MDNCENLCYITYAVKKDLLEGLLHGEKKETAPPPSEPRLFPPGFVPEWYLKGGFPEDDIE